MVVEALLLLPLLLLLHAVGNALGAINTADIDLTIATAQANAVRNRQNRLLMVNWTATRLTIPTTTNAPGHLWSTSVTHGAPLQNAISTLFRNDDAAANAEASQFLENSLPTWYNGTFGSHPAGTGRGACHISPDGSIPLDCYGSGCPLEQALLVRAFALFASTSAHVKAGTVGKLARSTEAALEKFYFRYLVGNYAWCKLHQSKAGGFCQLNISVVLTKLCTVCPSIDLTEWLTCVSVWLCDARCCRSGRAYPTRSSLRRTIMYESQRSDVLQRQWKWRSRTTINCIYCCPDAGTVSSV
eukprot:COSAG02_NODE_372_length_23640_cov_210.100463_21_plen_300_part_00